MNKLRLIIPTLIKINLVVALLSVVFVIIIREQQAQMTTYTQQSLDQPDLIPPQLKDKIANYQQRLQENQEKIHRYEQQLKGLKAELEEYKAQNALLMQANQGRTEKVASANLSQRPQVIPSSSSQTKKPTLVKSVSLSPTTQERESPKPIKAIDRSMGLSSTETLSASETLDPANGATTQEIQPEKKVEVNLEPENRLYETIPTLASIDQNTDQPGFSPHLSQQQTNTRPIYSAVRSLELDNTRDLSTHYANHVAYGLAVAADEGQINHGTKMYKKVQTAIRLLRRGETKEEATRKANVPPSVMNQLMKWGEKRPGSLIAAGKEE